MWNLRTLSILDSAIHSFSALRSTTNQFKSSISPFVFPRLFPSLKYVFPPHSCFDNFAFCLSLSQVFLTFTINYPWLFFSVPGDDERTVGSGLSLDSVHHLENVFLSVLVERKGKHRRAFPEFLPFLFFLLTKCTEETSKKYPRQCNIAKNKHKAYCLFVKSCFTITQGDNWVCVCSSVWPCTGSKTKNISSCPYLHCLELQSLLGN